MKISRVTRWKGILAAFAMVLVAAPVSADIVSTEEALTAGAREKVRVFMERDGVEQQLKAMGVAPDVAKKRVDSMTDEEILQVAGRIDTLAAGGALDKTDWILILLIAILVVLAL